MIVIIVNSFQDKQFASELDFGLSCLRFEQRSSSWA